MCGFLSWGAQMPSNLFLPLLRRSQQSLNKSRACGSAWRPMNIWWWPHSFFLTSSLNSAGSPLSWGCCAAAFLRLKRSEEVSSCRGSVSHRDLINFINPLQSRTDSIFFSLDLFPSLQEEDVNLKTSKQEGVCPSHFFLDLFPAYIYSTADGWRRILSECFKSEQLQRHFLYTTTDHTRISSTAHR